MKIPPILSFSRIDNASLVEIAANFGNKVPYPSNTEESNVDYRDGSTMVQSERIYSREFEIHSNEWKDSCIFVERLQFSSQDVKRQ